MEKKITLVELAKKWINKEVTDEEAKEIYDTLNIYEPEEIDDEIFWTCGNDNAWLDVEADENISTEDFYRFNNIIFNEQERRGSHSFNIVI